MRCDIPDTHAAILRSRGFRMTPQREMIVEVLGANNRHMTAEDIFSQIQKHTTTLNIATVYRTLDLFVEQGLARRNDLGGGKVEYAAIQHGTHIHLVCRCCSRVIEADFPLKDSLESSIQDQSGFNPDLGHISIFGLCQDCQSSGSRKV